MKDGTVTAGNAAQQNDAAAACLIVAEDKLQQLKLQPLAYLMGWTAVGCHPAMMGIGPVPAVRKLFAKTGLSFDQMDLVEVNEAFACQVLAVLKGWSWNDPDRLNVNGSGISLGPPDRRDGRAHSDDDAVRARATARPLCAGVDVHRRRTGNGGDFRTRVRQRAMQAIQLRIDVSSAVPLSGPLEVALTAYLPDPGRLCSPPIVMAAFPGGGYSRGYFDMSFAGHAQYSEAEHHTAAGLIFIAGDHLGVGESSVPDFSKLSIEMIAAGNDFAVREVLRRLETGTLTRGFPAVNGAAKIGIGQSMGGCITIVMQGNHRTYDAVAPLGYSAIHTTLPQRSDAAYHASMQAHAHARNADLTKLSVAEASTHVADFVYPFHWEDVPKDILDADMSGGYPLRKASPPFGSLTVPTCALQMMAPSCVAKEAAAIEAPVLIGVGARDVCPDPHAEPGAYKHSRDVSLYIVPRMAHMHNFASTRRLLWDRLVEWSRIVSRHVEL